MNLRLNEDKKDILEQTGIPSQAIQAFYIIYDFVFSICLVVNFTVLGWGWGFLVMADKLVTFSKPLIRLAPLCCNSWYLCWVPPLDPHQTF